MLGFSVIFLQFSFSESCTNFKPPCYNDVIKLSTIPLATKYKKFFKSIYYCWKLQIENSSFITKYHVSVVFILHVFQLQSCLRCLLEEIMQIFFL